MICKLCQTSTIRRLQISMRRNLASKSTNPDDAKLTDISQYPPDKIRNFSIVAHIDHGKSTLADRLLESTKTVGKVERAQFLDRLQVEQERGITVKAQTANMFYTSTKDGESYMLNLIDTPGHVDFSYEVSRSLAACDAVLLVVDANQGVQAQTVSNFWLAMELDLPIIPVLNKIDLPKADVARVSKQIEDMLDIPRELCIPVSAKSGLGIPELLECILERVPAPVTIPEKPLKALIFDSWFIHFRGAIASVMVKDGFIEKGQNLTSMQLAKSYEVQEVGIMSPDPTPVRRLQAGQVGYIVANMKTVQEALVGDTLCWTKSQEGVEPLPGFKRVKQMVYAGVFPFEPQEHDSLRNALEKLVLNDPSVSVEMDSNPALGQGWRMGFLGLLHLEVFSQRLNQEYDAAVIITAPSVPYKARIKDNAGIRKRYNNQADYLILDPAKFPLITDIEYLMEPTVIATIITPQKYHQAIIQLCDLRRGKQLSIGFLDDGNRVLLRYHLPLAEVIVDFFNQIKMVSSGFASFDYEPDEYQRAALVKLSILLNSNCVEEFSTIVHETQAKARGREICEKLVTELPRQTFPVKIQAAIGGKIVARTNITAVKKNVAAKLKGNFGDGSRLEKLLKHQRKGIAERLKMYGNVEVPREAFINVVKR